MSYLLSLIIYETVLTLGNRDRASNFPVLIRNDPLTIQRLHHSEENSLVSMLMLILPFPSALYVLRHVSVDKCQFCCDLLDALHLEGNQIAQMCRREEKVVFLFASQETFSSLFETESIVLLHHYCFQIVEIHHRGTLDPHWT